MIPAALWNQLVDRLRRSRVLSVLGAKGAGRGWRHPWHTSLAWSQEEDRWVARVQPGFVNGSPAEVRVLVRDAPAATLTRLAYRAGPRPASTEPVAARLTENPVIFLPSTIWRIAGQEGRISGAALPAYFVDPRGLGLETGSPGAPLVRVAYLTLSVERVRAATAVDAEGALSTIYVSPPPSPPVLLLSREESTGPSGEPLTLENLSGMLQLLTADPGRDTLPIARLWLVSPPGTTPGADTVPDGSWRSYVEHRQFWNLVYALSRPQGDFAATRLELPIPLVGGDAVQGILDQANILDAALSAAIGRGIVRGRFASV